MTSTTGSLPLWAVSDDAAIDALPDGGFIKEYVEEVTRWTDSPTIYHLGSCFSMLSTLLGKCTLRVRLSEQANYYMPIRMWTSVIGDSGDRKSQAMRIARKCMMKGHDELFVPSDGTLEAWHDAMAGDLNPKILTYDELAMLFDFSKRSYAVGTVSWLLSVWEGHNHTRMTKANGKVTVYNPRLTILGGIPPNTFAVKTKKDDWSSGFLARWSYFAGRRTRFQAVPYYDDKIQETMNTWTSRVPWGSNGHILIDHKACQCVMDWVRINVEDKRDRVNPEIFSALNRLQDTTFLLAALIDVSKQQSPIEQHLYVSEASCQEALRVTNLLYSTLLGLFSTVTANAATREESEVCRSISDLGGRATISQICEKTGLSRETVRKHLVLLHKDCMIIEKTAKPKGPGRPSKVYSLV